MRFLYPHILWLLVPLFLIGVYAVYRIVRLRKEIKRFGEYHLVKQLMPDLSLRRRLNKDFILIIATALIIFAAARPQMGTKKETVEKSGIEAMICLDLSNSMLAQDVSPSRLAVAKNIVSRLFDKMVHDRVGLIFFTSSAYVQLPLTNDLVSGKMFLSQANPAIMPTQGTNIAKALSLAQKSFSNSDEAVGRTIIIISDVEDHSDVAVQEAKNAVEKGVTVNVVGVGTDDGGPINVAGEGYIKDSDGNIVISKINDEIGKEIAAAGNGIYVKATGVNAATAVLTKALSNMETAEFEKTVYSAYDEKFGWFLFPALILLMVDFIYLNRKNRYLSRISLFDNNSREDE